jgi:hypothetical protein
LSYKICSAAKKFKIGLVPYLGLEITIHVIKSQIHLVRQSNFMMIRFEFAASWGEQLAVSRLQTQAENQFHLLPQAAQQVGY